MRVLKVLVGFIFMSTIANAQELTRSNYPDPGDVFTNYVSDTTGITEKSSGDNQNWDYAGQLDVLDSIEQEYFIPENTPGADSFPNTDMAVIQVNTQDRTVYTYFNVNDSAVMQVGQYGVVQTQAGDEIEFKLSFLDSAKVREFPMGYNDSFSDEYLVNDTITFEQNGFPIEQQIYSEGTVKVKIDGIGALQTNSETFNDVLRLKTVNLDSTHQNTQGFGSFSQVSENTSYEFYHGDGKTPLLQISSGTTKVDGQTYTNKTVLINEDLKKASGNETSIEENAFVQQMLTFPNPVENQFNLVLSLKKSAPVSARIINANGQEMLYKDFGTIAQGNVHKTFNTQQWDSGIYFLQIQTDEGTESRKFIVK